MLENKTYIHNEINIHHIINSYPLKDGITKETKNIEHKMIQDLFTEINKNPMIDEHLIITALWIEVIQG